MSIAQPAPPKGVGDPALSLFDWVGPDQEGTCTACPKR